MKTYRRLRFCLLLSSLTLINSQTEAQWVKRSIFGPAGDFVVCGNNIFAEGYPKTVFVSTDDALTWKNIGNDSLGWVRAVAADTSTPSLKLFVATDGAGVWFTSDEGQSWHREQNLETRWMTAIGINGSNIFAGTDQDSAGRGQWSLGAFLSSDEGTHWSTINNGLTDSINSRRIRGFFFYKNEVLMRTDSGFFISNDTGKYWRPSGFPFSTIGGFAATDSFIFITRQDTPGIFRSNDRGKKWEHLTNGVRGYAQTLASSGNHLFAGTDSGVYVSNNFGDSWRQMNEGLQDTNAMVLFAKGSYLYAYAESPHESAIWRRPLSDFDGQNSVVGFIPEVPNNNDIEIYDLLGRCIYHGNIDQAPILRSGAYIERVSGMIRKVLIE
jgi:photosystem II stability/assembly factor-like uncharacterized protein